MIYKTRKVSVRHVLGTTIVTDKDEKEVSKIVCEYEYPEYENFDEFVKSAGSPEAGLAFVNQGVRDACGDRVRENLTEAPETGTTEVQIITIAQTVGKSFTPIVKTTNKEKGLALDQILALVKTSGADNPDVQEQLLALSARMA